MGYELIPNYAEPERSRVFLNSHRLHTDAAERHQEKILRAGQPYVRHRDNRIIYGASIVPTVKVFEAVEGAKITGLTRPGAVIRVSLQLRSQTGTRELDYTTETISDAAGRFQLQLPHATTRESPLPPSDLIALAPYLVRVLDSESGRTLVISEIEVEEQAVQSGSKIELDLRDHKS